MSIHMQSSSQISGGDFSPVNRRQFQALPALFFLSLGWNLIFTACLALWHRSRQLYWTSQHSLHIHIPAPSLYPLPPTWWKEQGQPQVNTKRESICCMMHQRVKIVTLEDINVLKSAHQVGSLQHKTCCHLSAEKQSSALNNKAACERTRTRTELFLEQGFHNPQPPPLFNKPALKLTVTSSGIKNWSKRSTDFCCSCRWKKGETWIGAGLKTFNKASVVWPWYHITLKRWLKYKYGEQSKKLYKPVASVIGVTRREW